jgi:DNA-binding NtrC family response regulator
MLVDDETALVDLGTRLLTRLGYRARGYRSAEAALAAFMADPEAFDLVFTDLTMPGMAGSELARQLVARRPGLPVILTTGYAGALGPEELSAFGIRELVSKPFDLHSFGVAIARCLRPEEP